MQLFGTSTYLYNDDNNSTCFACIWRCVTLALLSYHLLSFLSSYGEFYHHFFINLFLFFMAACRCVIEIIPKWALRWIGKQTCYLKLARYVIVPTWLPII